MSPDPLFSAVVDVMRKGCGSREPSPGRMARAGGRLRVSRLRSLLEEVAVLLPPGAPTPIYGHLTGDRSLVWLLSLPSKRSPATRPNSSCRPPRDGPPWSMPTTGNGSSPPTRLPPGDAPEEMEFRIVTTWGDPLAAGPPPGHPRAEADPVAGGRSAHRCDRPPHPGAPGVGDGGAALAVPAGGVGGGAGRRNRPRLQQPPHRHPLVCPAHGGEPGASRRRSVRTSW